MKLRITYDYGYEKDKEIIIDNCMSKLHGKMRLHEYLVKKHGKKNLVVKSCVENNDMFGGIFNDIFK